MMRRLVLLFFLFLVSFNVLLAYNNEDYAPIRPENINSLQEQELIGNGAMTNAVAWSPDGSRIVVGGMRGLYVYEDIRLEPEFIDLSISVRELLFADETLFFSDYTTIYAYDFIGRRMLYSLEGQTPLAISQSGSLLAYEVDRGVRVLDIATGEIHYDLSYSEIFPDERDNRFDSLENYFNFAQFMENDSKLIVASSIHQHGMGYAYEEYQARVWNLENEAIDPSYESLTIEPNASNFLATRPDGELFRINLDRLVSDVNPQMNPGLVQNYRYAIHGNYFALSFQESRGDGIIREVVGLWDVREMVLLHLFHASGKPVFSPDGILLAIGNEIFEIETGESQIQFRAETYRIIQGLDDRILKIGIDESISLLDAESLEALAVLPSRFSDLREFPLKALSDGSFFLIDMNARAIIRIHGETGAEISRIPSPDSAIFHVLPSANPSFAAMASIELPNSGYVYRIWNTDTGEEIILPESFLVVTGGSYGMGSPFHPDGSLLVWEDSRSELHFYELETSSILRSFPSESHPDSRDDVAPPRYTQISYDGRFLFLGNFEDSQLWSLESNSLLVNFEGAHTMPLFHYDYGYFTYIRARNFVEIYELETGNLLGSVEMQDVGNVYFASERVIVLEDNYTYEPKFAFDFVSNEILEIPEEVLPRVPVLRNEGFLIYHHDGALSIENAEGVVLGRVSLDMGLAALAFSSDMTRFYIAYGDGTVGIWAVEE